MTKYFQITKNVVISFILAFLMIFILIGRTAAQESPDDLAKKYNVSFPIAELGGCSDYASCRTYCEDPVNSAICIDYAKQKGFYEEDQIETHKDEILAAASVELGCDSKSSCMAVCSEPANFDRCNAFAKKHSLGGGHVTDPSTEEFLARAKEVLGCDSPTSCMSFCNNEANRQKCSDFAQQVGLRGGEHQAGPGGCTSEETCRAFCSDPANYQICDGFSSAGGEKFSGPGGCESESACRAYCEKNPQECGYVGNPGESPPPGYSPQEMCLKTPGCEWRDNTCQCSSSSYSPYPEYTPNPSGSTTSFDPATECSKNPGCSWTGSSCQCSSTTETNSPVPENSPTVQGAATGAGLLQFILNWLLGESK